MEAESDINNDGNDFYRNHSQKVLVGFIVCLMIMLIMVIVLLYQLKHRPIPPFVAVSPDGQKMQLHSYDDPNLLSSTLIKWASKAAVAAYTYDFYNYPGQLQMAQPYFTEAGWTSYRQSIQALLDTITTNKLFVNGVVSSPPVISNQGSLGGYDRVWRIQIPFLVTFQSSESTTNASYMVNLMIVKVPTTENPAAIAIDQFVMG
jgi:intracellular multiplication protein IcmL